MTIDRIAFRTQIASGLVVAAIVAIASRILAISWFPTLLIAPGVAMAAVVLLIKPEQLKAHIQALNSAFTATATLEVVESESMRSPLFLTQGELIVGRKPDSGIFGIGDRYMSHPHARFRLINNQVTVTDLDSKNRTFVNEKELRPHIEQLLCRGDIVRMGNTYLRLV
jgi:pSer/pThr/pTyr-binding forkhead associated (FHA) protein